MPVSQSPAGIAFIGLLIAAYLIGSIPWGVIFARIFAHHDIRLKGSRNIGATNVTREAGVVPGLLTLAGDILKGAIPVYLALLIFGPPGATVDIHLAAVALAAFLGHLFPLYLKFRDGGKGVATAAGCFAVITPLAVLVACVVFFVTLFLFRRVSIGSLSAAVVLPIAVWFAVDGVVIPAVAVILALLIFIRHRTNLQRLLAGNEPAFTLRKNSSDR